MAVVNSTAALASTTGATLGTVAANATDGNAFSLPKSASALYVEVSNGTASPISVVVDDPTSVGPAAATAFDPDVTVTAPVGLTQFVILDVARFRDPVTGRIKLTASAVTTVTFKVSYLP